MTRSREVAFQLPLLRFRYDSELKRESLNEPHSIFSIHKTTIWYGLECNGDYPRDSSDADRNVCLNQFPPNGNSRLLPNGCTAHWEGYVDVRSAPRNRFNNLRTTVPNGTELEVIGEQGDWLEIYSPEPGWVAQSQTRRICSRDGRPRRANRDYDDYRDYDNYRD